MHYFREVAAALKAQDAADVLLFGGGIVPDQDLPALAELGAGRIFTPGAELPTVLLRIKPESAWMLEYYSLDVVREFDDGGVEATMRYASEDWLLRLLLGFGTQITILDNAALAAKLRSAAAAAQSAYAQSESLLT